MKRIKPLLAVAFASVVALSAVAQHPATPRLRLATTTSTEQSGLLDAILPAFEKETGYKVEVVAVGTGASLKIGEKGDCDVVLVHARALEDAFMAAGSATSGATSCTTISSSWVLSRIRRLASSLGRGRLLQDLRFEGRLHFARGQFRDRRQGKGALEGHRPHTCGSAMV